MDVIEEKVPRLMMFLKDKARRRSAISYSAVFNFFDSNTHRSDVWETFEEACRRIAPAEEAIYGALLAKKDTNLPSTGSYDIYKNIRHEEYLSITGVKRFEAYDLTLDQMGEIAQLERDKVYQHAIENT
ncbi:MAG: hypothetical protein WD071_06855 [Pseudohongiella sp.]|uniref:hypothetical protein n=1 Tax=Pseudohongiella sp. TaxID=1979412 RepID=UPI0034A05865